MRKFYFLFFLFVLFFYGCNTNTTKSPEEVLQCFYNQFTLPDEISSDLELQTSYFFEEKEILAFWTTDDANIITVDGTIFPTYTTNYVSIHGTFTYLDKSITKSFDLTILPLDKSITANKILDTIDIPSSTNYHLTLPSLITYEKKNFRVFWESNNTNILSNEGEIIFSSDPQIVTMTATITFESEKFKRDFTISIIPINTNTLNSYFNNLNIPEKLNSSITLPTEFLADNIPLTIEWKSDNPEILSNFGTKGIVLENTNVLLTAIINIDSFYFEKDFNILVTKSSDEDIINNIRNTIYIPSVVSNDLYFPISLDNNILLSWSSENESLLSSDGIINKQLTRPTELNLTLNIKIGDNIMTTNYDLILNPVKHFLMYNVFDGEKNNIELTNEGKLILSDNCTEGTYYSNEIIASNFSELVATWGATSSKNATCELFVSLKVNGTYSQFISYGKWGLGLQNGSTGQDKDLIKLVEDEVKVKNNNYADGIKFKIVLKRDNSTIKSPEVSFVTFALNLINYNYTFDSSLIKNSVKYDVPKLYQHDVPTIGNSICSITSSTMLLKYKGHDFSSYDSLEHRYLASLFKDYGNNIFGNWVYNCVGMSAYGERAYVKRFFNTYEFLYSIQEIGPMAASIKGTVKYTRLSDNIQGSYTSGGHLLVVTGYEIIDNQTFIFINDPNVTGVAIKMNLEDFLSIWRNVSYIVE